MKNKHGIEIRVGQVWDGHYGKNEIIFIDTESRLVYFRSVDDYLKMGWGGVGSNYLDHLISCPVLGDMSEWDIVTDEQKRRESEAVRQLKNRVSELENLLIMKEQG